MTVVRTPSGVVVHNAFELDAEDLDWLKSLGELRAIVAPNTFHCSDAGWLSRQFPNAALLVPEPKRADFERQGFHPADVARGLSGSLARELIAVPMLGSKAFETAFLHPASKTLVLCDLAFNMEDVFSGLGRVLMNWNKIGGRFGPSRLTKLVFASDKQALHASYQRLLEHDFARVIVNHGAVLPCDGRELLRGSVAEIFGSA
jgi:hypothetical protein